MGDADVVRVLRPTKEVSKESRTRSKGYETDMKCEDEQGLIIPGHECPKKS